nr:type IIL restriction-modification enzyme MmeI [Pseudoglutamicibacter albus]
MRVVAGRLKSDYRYSIGMVYNNFVGPEVTEQQRAEIARLGQGVLDARAQYSGATIAQLYDPKSDFLYPDLKAAHEALDAAVERAYGLEPGCPESEIVALLFKLYEQVSNQA